MPVNLSSFFCLTHGVQPSAVRCFRCFGRKITSGDASFLAEILGYRRFGERKNSKWLAVPSLFSAVLMRDIENGEGCTATENLLRVSIDKIRMYATIS
jgi:hypothetical protein